MTMTVRISSQIMNNSAKFIWAGIGAGDGRDYLVSLRDMGLDWEYIRYMLLSRKIGQLFYSELEQRGGLDLLPDQLVKDLQDMYQRVAAKNLMLFLDLEEFISLLNENDVPCLVMKGGALVIDGVFNLGERILADVDLLVLPEHFNFVRDLMVNRLYCSELKLSDAAPWQELHMVNPNNSHLEVHAEFRPINGISPEIIRQRLWSRARNIEYKGLSLMLPAYEDLLLQDAVHAGMHHLFSPDYIFPAVPDIMKIVERWFEQINWQALLELAEKERARDHLLLLILLAEKIFEGKKLTSARGVISEILPGWDDKLDTLTDSLLDIMMQSEPFSLDFLIYFLARTAWSEKYGAIKKMLISRWGKRYVEIDDQTFDFPRHGSMERIFARFKKLRVSYMRFFYNMARFYRSIDYLPP